MPRCLPLCCLILAAVLVAMPARAEPERGSGAVTGSRGLNGAGSVAATLQGQGAGFIAKTGVSFDIPANSPSTLAWRWDQVAAARREATGKAMASLSLPPLPWFVPFWQAVRLEASLAPQAGEGEGRVSTILSRSWSLIGLSGASEDRYTVIQDGLFGRAAPVTRWEVARSTRLEMPWHTTVLLLGGQFNSTDRLLTGSVGAEQTVFGPLKISASLIDLGQAQIGGKITAGFSLKW